MDAMTDAPTDGGLSRFDPPPTLPDLTPDEVSRMATTIDTHLRSVPQASYSVQVVLGDTGQVLFEENPDALLIPASNTKLFTTAAALDLLGEDHQFTIRALSEAGPDAAGRIGDLIIVADHDPTLSTTFYPSASAPLESLARRLAAAGVTRIDGRVLLRGEILFDGARFGELDPSRERQEAAAALDTALRNAGITAAASARPEPSFASAPAMTALAEVRSRALHVVASHINDISHNEMADQLIRLLGFQFRRDSGLVPGGQEVTAWLGTTDVEASGATFSDGSGLSYANRVSARQVIELLRFMDRTLPRYRRGLAIAGADPGTLRNRLGGADTRGRVFGKTGTLNVSIALSGILHNRYDGRPYYFSLLANDLTRELQTAVRGAFDRIVETIGQNHRGAGARLASPTLRCLVAEGDAAQLSWDPVAGADGYLVWRSTDGELWPRSEAHRVNASSHRFAMNGQAYVRVSALSADGESEPSDVFGTRSGSAPILLVDGADRWARQPVPENTLAANHDFLTRYGAALGAQAFDSCDHGALIAGERSLGAYSAAVWVLGEESTEDETFDRAEQMMLSDYISQGGGLVVSGAEVGWDLVEQGDAQDQRFYQSVLRAGFLGDSADTFLARGVPGGIFAEVDTVGFFDPRGVLASFPDRLGAEGNATVVLEYEGGAGGGAAIASDHVVYFGFPLESVEMGTDREALLRGALDHVLR
ncbi:MAG: D-alanyl-D-alanine carboxypeptidase [Myxococcota bacterium]